MALRAQDAAVEERLNKLSAQIQDLADAKDAQNRRIEELSKQLRELQEQQGKPNAGSVTQEDLKQLAAKLREIDEKRQQDNEHVIKELDKLGRTLGASGPRKPVATPPTTPSGDVPTSPDKGYEYVIQSGDSLTVIARAYSEKVIKVTADQIQKANPGLKPDSIRLGQVIVIPALKDAPPPETEAAADQAPVFASSYLVAKGDTLWSLSLRYEVKPELLAERNSLSLGSVLREGMALRVPILKSTP